jgi:hypothetical protein
MFWTHPRPSCDSEGVKIQVPLTRGETRRNDFPVGLSCVSCVRTKVHMSTRTFVWRHRVWTTPSPLASYQWFCDLVTTFLCKIIGILSTIYKVCVFLFYSSWGWGGPHLQLHLTPVLLDSEVGTPLLHPLRSPITTNLAVMLTQRLSLECSFVIQHRPILMKDWPRSLRCSNISSLIFFQSTLSDLTNPREM